MKYAIELNRAQAIRIIGQACQEKAGVIIQPKSWDGKMVLSGQVLKQESDQLWIELQPDSPLTLEGLLHMYCSVDLEIGDGRYFFDSHILGIGHVDVSPCVMMAFPETLLVLQRRRSTRKAMAESSAVQLTREAEGSFESLQGQLYNLGSDGLAFKLRTVAANQLAVGQEWWVCFEIPEEPEYYKLPGIVRRLVPSSSEGFVIVGMEFDPTGEGSKQLEQLRQFLSIRKKTHQNMH